jgi:hypothetical protein
VQTHIHKVDAVFHETHLPRTHYIKSNFFGARNGGVRLYYAKWVRFRGVNICHSTKIMSTPKVRQRIVSLAQGKVLEIGVGPGVNFVHCMALFTLLPAAFPYLAIAFPLARFAES